MPKPAKLVNRGAAGLLNKTASNGSLIEAPKVDRLSAPKDNIQCDGEVVDINSLVPDPMNARLHPDRNMDAIMDSLCLYGQRMPLVVRKENRYVAAGNGRLEAMKKLGWTKVAVSIRPMTDVEFHGYALTDNRTAELAAWDLEVVAKVDQLVSSLGNGAMPGWSMAELEALRAMAVPKESPEDFPEVGEDIEVEYCCPKCNYRWSGGKPVKEDAQKEKEPPLKTKQEKLRTYVEAAAGVPLDPFEM